MPSSLELTSQFLTVTVGTNNKTVLIEVISADILKEGCRRSVCTSATLAKDLPEMMNISVLAKPYFENGVNASEKRLT